MKLIKSIIIFITIFSNYLVFAQDWVIIPEAGGDGNKGGTEVIGAAVDKVSEADGKIWDKYTEVAKELEDNTGAQIGSGIMNWDTILSYLKHLVSFMSNLSLVVGALSVVYAGYLYGIYVFKDEHTKGKDAIIKAIQGVIVVISAYAILRILYHMFLA